MNPRKRPDDKPSFDDSPPLSFSPDELGLLSSSPRSNTESTIAKLMGQLRIELNKELNQEAGHSQAPSLASDPISAPIAPEPSPALVTTAPEPFPVTAPQPWVPLSSSRFKFRESEEHDCVFGFDEEVEDRQTPQSGMQMGTSRGMQ